MEYLFRGQRTDSGEWVSGFIRQYKEENKYFIEESIEGRDWKVIPETIGEYTGVTEFDPQDTTVNKKIFEGDIVEVFGFRGYQGQRKSPDDGVVRLRGVIKHEQAKFIIDLETGFNKSVVRAKGKEKWDRDLPSAYALSDYYLSEEMREFYRQNNCGDYIRVIGNLYDNPELLNEVK